MQEHTSQNGISQDLDKLVVLDFGGQYAHLIANRIRRLGVYTEIKDGEVSADELKGYQGIIMSGGPASTLEEGSPQCDKRLFELGVPVLGICYGHQLIVRNLGGEVAAGTFKEYGYASLKIDHKEGIFKSGMEDQEQVWMNHGDTVVRLPEGFITLGSTEDCKEAAIANLEKNFYGIQFHGEVTHTPHGMNIFSNFVDLCGVKKSWSIDNFMEEEMARIKEQVKDNNVFLMVSGGVDSTVAFALLEKTLGADKVYGLYVDTGFMRLNESAQIESSLKQAGFKNLHIYNASEEYFEALKGVSEPEEKRKIIGKLFLEVQAKKVKALGLNPDHWILAQGTIYPDTIETGATKHADKIKTHHNRVEEVQKLIEEGKVIEPLKELYKDEVRELGTLLGLPYDLIHRHPFPGPGLAVRCLCNDKKAEDLYPENHKQSEEEINELLAPHGLKGMILPLKSVGVQGDARSYRNPLAIYGQEVDFGILDELATKIINRFAAVNRVIYTPAAEMSGVEVATEAYLTPERITVLQKADDAVQRKIKDEKIHEEIWQFPVVLIPLSLNGRGTESIVLRPVWSLEAMTANFYRMPQEIFRSMREELLAQEQISEVFYDVTNKPPGTIEWE